MASKINVRAWYTSTYENVCKVEGTGGAAGNARTIDKGDRVLVSKKENGQVYFFDKDVLCSMPEPQLEVMFEEDKVIKS